MALSGWDFLEYEYLCDDELIDQAIDKLTEKNKKIANYIQKTYPEKECEKCENDTFDYFHNKAVCCNCGNEVKKEITHQEAAKLGCASRKLESIIKELFAGKMGRQRKKERPNEKTLKSLKYDLYSFDTGEYSDEEVKFLNKRFEELMEQVDKEKGSDPMMVRAMVIQELVLFNLQRKEAIGEEIDYKIKKNEYGIYRDLSSDMKFKKDTRDNESEQDAILSLISENEELNADLDIDDDLKKFLEKYDDLEEKKKKAKDEKLEVGNPYG